MQIAERQKRVEVDTFLERERRDALDAGSVRSLVNSLCDDRGREKYASLLDELREFAPDLLGAVDGEALLTVSRDAMEVSIEILPPFGSGAPITSKSVYELLRDRGIIFGISRDAVERVVRNGASSKSMEIVARGHPAIAGKPRTVALIDFEDSRLFVEDVTGAMDLKSFTRIRTVQEGEIIAEITPASKGIDGRTCCGIAIAADVPVEKTWALGTGVAVRDGCAVAMHAGQLRTDGGILSVLPILVINGNVDYGTGNITFPGSVHIKGDVMDNFSVYCSGDLRVGGNVYAANLDIAKDIDIRGGIVGHGEGLVRAGGSIAAKYIENATVEATGDIRIAKAIIHSCVSSNGSITLTAHPGVIMGGEIAAARGLTCNTLGCVSSTRTDVRVGENFMHAQKKVRLRETVEFLKKELLSLDSTRARHINDGASEEMVSGFDKQMNKIRAGLRTLLSRDVELAKQESDIYTDWIIEVRNRTYPGVHFYYRNHNKTFDSEASASSFRYDASTESIAVACG